jgi:AraC family transcriptional regulator
MLRSLGGSTPVVNSKPVRTRDYSVEVQWSGPATLPAIYHNFHRVAVTLSGERLVVQEGAGGGRWTRFAPGESSVHAAGPGPRVTWPTGAHCLYVHLHPRLIRRVGEEIWGVSGLAPETRPWLRDPVIRDIGFQLRHLIDRATPTDPRAAHDLVIALAHHVIVSYAADASPGIRVGTLSVEAILDAFRDDSPNWDGVATLAARCGLTRSHFSRRVRALTGLSPYAMVLGSRVEAAKNLLERREMPLSGVAYATGFADQSHLTRVFRRATGITPARYRMMGAAAFR